MTETPTLKDFMGNELNIGDTVVYASLAGRSAKLTKGKIVAFKASGVQVQRESTSWGGDVSKQTRWVDSRTGKGIDPSYAKHQERGYGYVNQKTGEYIRSEDYYHHRYTNYQAVQDWYQKHGYGWGYYSTPKRPEYILNPDFVDADWKSVSPIYKDYVTEVEKAPPPVTVGTGSMLKVMPEWTAQDAEVS